MYNSLLNLALDAALKAGEEILRIYNDPSQDFGIERKADNSPLTLADKSAHKCIETLLSCTDIPLLSEEGTQLPFTTRKSWKRLWIVDPLDGTKEFIKKNGEFTVNIALVENGNPILGVIYVPVSDTLYYGVVGQGAWKKVGGKNAVAMPCETPHNGFVIVASRSHLSPETESYIDDAQKKYQDVTTISSGSSIKICLVADGMADAYPRFAPTMEWDTAAGDAIARAAGRSVTNAETKLPLTYNKEDLHNPWFIVD